MAATAGIFSARVLTQMGVDERPLKGPGTCKTPTIWKIEAAWVAQPQSEKEPEIWLSSRGLACY